MPWKNETPMETKHRFITLAQSDRYTITELCVDFGISRKTGHKWLERYASGGLKALEGRSRSPINIPGRTAAEVERLIVQERRLHETWGGKKIRQVLATKHGIEILPAVSTVNAIVSRNGLVKPQRRRGGVFKVERGALTVPDRSQHVLGVDFKGWFLTGDGERFAPLTVTDLYSRYLMRADGLPQATTKWTLKSFRALFRREGVPEIIRVDNGAPFASTGPGGLSRLSVWWIGLGIEVQYSRPGCPQDNGSHERMHRTMKAECCKPPSPNRKAQQQRMDRWKSEFNNERPHESIGMRRPAELYQPSVRRLNERIKPDLYELGTETCLVSESGHIALDKKCYYVGESFGGVRVAVKREEMSPEIHVRYANVKLGTIDASPSARLRPSAYAGRWEKKACGEEEVTL